MRTLHRTVASFGILGLAGFAQLAGCSGDALLCVETNLCLPDGTRYKPTTEPPAGCEASPKDDPSVIKDECGIFVQASVAMSGDGSKASPFKTLNEGLVAAKSGKFRVYICAETYSEEAVDDSVSMFGGFDCTADWTYVGGPAKRATISPADGVPLRINGTGDLLVQDIVAQAPSYATAAMTGEIAKSSIATIVDGAKVDFTRCALNAGDGQEGATGEKPASSASLNGKDGNPGKDACTAGAGNKGGAQVSVMCVVDGTMVATVGAVGGDGGGVQLSPFKALPGSPGGTGEPALGAGQGGVGEPEMGMWGASDSTGKEGNPGENGGTGPGATLGAVDIAGYTPANGMPGFSGKPGQGGGGGGGAKGGQNICGSERAGASGGSGGTGGCGGAGGNAGAGGGASIGLISVNATVTLADSDVTAKNGGKGGGGADGQSGGNGGSGVAGGKGADMSKNGGLGGPGGSGGKGGPGGGGAGGPSFSIGFKGTQPQKMGSTTITPGTPGAGGPGGAGGNAGATPEVAQEMTAL